jgi:hypothetical protein
MGCNSTRGFGDLEDDKKYSDNESRPDNDSNENANDKNFKENKNDKNDNKNGKNANNKTGNNNDKNNGNKNDAKNTKKDDNKNTKNNDKNNGNKNEIKDGNKNDKKNTKAESKEGENINTDDNTNQDNDGNKEERKVNLNLQKEDYEGVLLMQGFDDCFPEDLTEEDVYKLVQDALNDKIVDDEENKEPGTINTKQAKAIANILYNKINKKDTDSKINLKKYPELKGVNCKVGVEKFTKDVVKKMMFQDKKVDDKQIDKAYSKINKDNEEYKALTIEILQ